MALDHVLYAWCCFVEIGDGGDYVNFSVTRMPGGNGMGVSVSVWCREGIVVCVG